MHINKHAGTQVEFQISSFFLLLLYVYLCVCDMFSEFTREVTDTQMPLVAPVILPEMYKIFTMAEVLLLLYSTIHNNISSFESWPICVPILKILLHLTLTFTAIIKNILLRIRLHFLL